MHRVLRRHLSSLALSALLLLVAGRVGDVQAQEKLKVATGAAGLYFIVHFVAEGGGFFKREGVELDTIDVTTGPRQVAAVMGGSVDIAPLGLQLVVQAVSRGGDMVAISAGYTILPMALVVSTSAAQRAGITKEMSPNERIKRLKGMKIGITGPGSGSDDMIRTLAGQRGLDPDKDITIQPLGNGDNMLAALERGATDGFIFTSPIPETAEARKIGMIVAEPLNGDVPEALGVPYIVMGTSRKTLEAKRPLLEKAVKAWTGAMKLIAEDRNEARRIARAYFKQMDEAVFNAAFDKYAAGAAKHPLLTEQDVQKVSTWMSLSKKTKIDADYASVVYPQIAIEVGKSMLGK